ncbi:MAG: hypothetical protein J6Y59_00280 [Bacteroidaceae bacterium]|nr:hypothetical protein [Bacteroidaceae bacterium]
METTNENISRLLEMLDNPSAYSEQEIHDIINHDVETREAYRLMVAAKQGCRREHTSEEADAQAAWQRFERKHYTQKRPLHRWTRIAAIFIAAALVTGLSFAAYHAISSRKTAEEISDSLAIANEKLIRLSKDGEVFLVTWTRGTWVVNAFGDSFREDALVRHSPFLRPNGVKIKIDGTEHDIHELLDKPASIVKKVELYMSTRTINLVTKPVQIPADVKGNINPDLTILLTGTVPKGAYQPVTIWKSKGIKESYDWHDYIYTSWTGKWENVRIHLKEAVNRKDHHVRINVCKGTPQKHIDRIKSIMQECDVTNYEIVKQ